MMLVFEVRRPPGGPLALPLLKNVLLVIYITNSYVTGSGKSGLKSPMIKQQKLAEMPFRWKISNFRFLAYIIK